MTKQAFLARLRDGLAGLPEEDIAERLTFYGDMIDDRVEDGIPEEAAVGEIGAPDALVAQIIADMPLSRLVKESVLPKRRMRASEIVLLVLGSPLWLSLLIVAVAVLFVLYAAVWSVVIAFWAVFACLAAGGLTGVAAGAYLAATSHALTGVALAGTGLLCAGLCIFAFFGSKAAAKGVCRSTKKAILFTKNRLIRKEGAR